MRVCATLIGALLLFAAFGVSQAWGSDQAGKKLSAREIFYSAPSAGREAAAPKRAPAPEPVVEPVLEPAPLPLPEPVQEAASAKPAPPAKPAQAAPVEPRPPAARQEAEYVLAAHADEPLVPLGLRYSILKRIEGADIVEVDPDITFRAGDRIRLRIEVNDAGYLYIIHRGSSGIWRPLFPSPEILGGDNVVEKGRSYDIPSGYVFTFDEQPGVEKLFLVFSRQPEADLEQLIYKLSRGEAEIAAPEPAPAPPKAAEPKLLLAQNLVSINDSLVDRLRNAYARDLIIEKVDEETPGARKETAVYAVSPSGGWESRVVVDVSLNHR